MLEFLKKEKIIVFLPGGKRYIKIFQEIKPRLLFYYNILTYTLLPGITQKWKMKYPKSDYNL